MHSQTRPSCNECNEAACLAGVARNAMMNGDFPRTVGVLDAIAFTTAAARLAERPDVIGPALDSN
jgi:hypothetical protein